MQEVAKTLFAIVLSLVGPAPADTPSELQVQPGDKIVAIGDSITDAHGYLSDMNAVFALQYRDLKMPPIINRGVKDDKAESMVARFQKDVIEDKPAYVLINVGINDVWHRLKQPHDEKVLAEYKKNVAKMVDMAQKANIKVILLTPTIIEERADSEGNKRLAAYVEAEKQIAADKKCQIVDLHEMFLTALKKKPGEEKTWLTNDGVHMDLRGDAIIAVGILRALGVPDEKLAIAKSHYWPEQR